MLMNAPLQMPVTRRQSFVSLLLGASLVSSAAESRASEARRISEATNSASWLTLPPTPNLPTVARQGLARINGTEIFFAQFGKGAPVLMLHGGLANSNYWAHQ